MRPTPQLPGWADRVSRTTRSAAVRTLQQHTALGRLSRQEYEHRRQRVDGARRNDEIDAQFADLPAPHPRFRVYRMSGFGCTGLLLWVASAGCALYGGATWLPFLIVTPLVPLLMAVNWLVMRRRHAEARSSPHERQRRLLRYGQDDLDRLLLSDHERAAVPDTLVVHLASGRLSRADYETRVRQVAGLRTRGELRELMADLPPPEPPLADTALAVEQGEPPHGVGLALMLLVWMPGLPLAITAWTSLDQWYWVPVWVVAAVVLGQRHRFVPAHAERRRRARAVH